MRPTTEAAAAALLALVTAVLVTGCDTTLPEPDGAPAPTRTAEPAAPTTGEAAPAPQRRQEPAAPALPSDPPPDDAAALARHLTLAHRTVHRTEAERDDVRRAARLEQLAARMLARGPARYAEQVLDRLDGDVRQRTEAHVVAARLLGGMTEPQPELPDWRIVQPPAPERLLSHYRAAERAVGVPWEYLAAIHLVETRMGRIRGVSTAGALGPMQFLPTTWDLYGQGGDIHDPRDAVMAAARLLRANGAPRDMAGALWHYNPSDSYVEAVELYAGQLRRAPATYHGYWHWRVLYHHVDGTHVLEPGYPRRPATRLR